MKNLLTILVILIVVGCNSDDKKIDFGKQLIKNITQFQETNNELPETDNWEQLEGLGFEMHDMGTVPTYQQVSKDEYELIYLEGFDAPYLMYNSKSDEWTNGFPSPVYEPSPFIGEWKSKKKPFIYGSELTIKEDGTFNFSYGACLMGGFSVGKWKVDKEELILNSDSIDECLNLSEFGVYWVEVIGDSSTYWKPKTTIEGCKPDNSDEDYVWFADERFKMVNDTIIHLNPKDTIEIECQDIFYRLTE